MGVIFGVGIGIISALKQNTWVDTSAMFVALIGVSLPIYWLALMLIYALAVNNRIFPPASGLMSSLSSTAAPVSCCSTRY